MALIMSGIACYVKRHPDKIAGFNALPPEKKNNVELQVAGRYIFKGMLIASWSAVGFAYLMFCLTGNEARALTWSIMWMIAGILVVALCSRKFDHNEKKKLTK